MRLNYSTTRKSAYIGYISQAIINNLAPLLFVTFQTKFGVSLEQISLLVTVNFVIQIFVDLMSIPIINFLGYRKTILFSQFFCICGLVGMSTLPFIMKNGFAALLLAVSLGAVGSGISEVIISPLLEALPSDNKSASMSLLHSFYSWGQVLVVLGSTVYFMTFGVENWRYLPLIWTIVPMVCFVMFTKVPICHLTEEGEAMPIKHLFSSFAFWIMIVLMISAGAAEQSMAQWASLFAETGLGVSKTLGDLLGPCVFAALMGISRLYYGCRGDRINLKKALALSSVLCILSYVVASVSRNPIIALLGCGFCGFSVGLMWPGIYSIAAHKYKKGGTSMFALLAFGGDIGCSAGPALVAFVSSNVKSDNGILSKIFSGSAEEIALKAGIGSAVVFPILMLLGIIMLCVNKRSKTKHN